MSQKRILLRPLVRELPADVETPISVYLKLRGLGPSFLLESVEGGEHIARYSFIGAQPRAILRSWRDKAVLEQAGNWREFPLQGRDVLDVLRAAHRLGMIGVYQQPQDESLDNAHTLLYHG
ncbi:MAG: hypothetical protein LLG44_10405 [Chloroflexi bacterium]|nr:hypothetical protein [Chloroflexota bacterium]